MVSDLFLILLIVSLLYGNALPLSDLDCTRRQKHRHIVVMAVSMYKIQL